MSDRSTPRLGAIYPDDAWVDVETQAYVNEFRAFLPATVEMISAATPVLPEEANVAGAIGVAESGHIEEASRRLLRYEPLCFAYYCTTVSFVRGPGSDLDIRRRITEATGVKAVTTASTGMILALRALGVSRVALASPYLPDVEQKLIEFVEARSPVQATKTASASGVSALSTTCRASSGATRKWPLLSDNETLFETLIPCGSPPTSRPWRVNLANRC